MGGGGGKWKWWSRVGEETSGGDLEHSVAAEP